MSWVLNTHCPRRQPPPPPPKKRAWRVKGSVPGVSTFRSKCQPTVTSLPQSWISYRGSFGMAESRGSPLNVSTTFTWRRTPSRCPKVARYSVHQREGFRSHRTPATLHNSARGTQSRQLEGPLYGPPSSVVRRPRLRFRPRSGLSMVDMTLEYDVEFPKSEMTPLHNAWMSRVFLYRAWDERQVSEVVIDFVESSLSPKSPSDTVTTRTASSSSG